MPKLIGSRGKFFLVTFNFFVPMLIYLCCDLGGKPGCTEKCLVALLLYLCIVVGCTFMQFSSKLQSEIVKIFFLLLVTVALLCSRVGISDSSGGSRVTLVVCVTFIFFTVYLASSDPVLGGSALSLERDVPSDVSASVNTGRMDSPIICIANSSISVPGLKANFVRTGVLGDLRGERGMVSSYGGSNGAVLSVAGTITAGMVFSVPSCLPCASTCGVDGSAVRSGTVSLLGSGLPSIVVTTPSVEFSSTPFDFQSVGLCHFLVRRSCGTCGCSGIVFLMQNSGPIGSTSVGSSTFTRLVRGNCLKRLPTI